MKNQEHPFVVCQLNGMADAAAVPELGLMVLLNIMMIGQPNFGDWSAWRAGPEFAAL